MRIVFMGTPEFSAPTLRKLVKAGHEVVLVVTQPDRVKGRGNKISPPEVKVVAQELGLKITQPVKMTDPGVMEVLKEAAPDAIAVVAFGSILKNDVLSLPHLGCVNAHASLLPKYRGAAPIQWAIAEGEDKTGVTTMLMDQGMDTGDVLLQREVKIDPDDTGGSLHDKLAPVAADLMVKTLERLESGDIRPVPQDDSLATYAPMIKKQDGRIDWTMPAKKIALRVRAFEPWPGTFCFLEDKQIRITKAVLEEFKKQAVPGTALSADKSGILVSCGDGALRLIELQPAGKRRMGVVDFLAGYPVGAGIIFH